MMGKFLPRVMPGTFRNCSKVKYVLTSVFLETFVMAWPSNAGFVYSNNIIKTNGNHLKSLKAVKDDLVQTMIAGWKIYPVSQNAIYLIPRNYRAFADSFVDLVWCTAISNL